MSGAPVVRSYGLSIRVGCSEPKTRVESPCHIQHMRQLYVNRRSRARIVDQRDCLRMVMSKFLTMDLYMVQTIRAYAPVASQEKMSRTIRPPVGSLPDWKTLPP